MEVIDFNEIKYKYLINNDEFTLQPAVMIISDKVRLYVAEMSIAFEKEMPKKDKTKKNEIKGNEIEIEEFLKTLKDTEKSIKIEQEIRKIQVKILQEVLIGKVENITTDNIRIDIFSRVLSDFFTQFQSSMTSASTLIKS